MKLPTALETLNSYINKVAPLFKHYGAKRWGDDNDDVTVKIENDRAIFTLEVC